MHIMFMYLCMIKIFYFVRILNNSLFILCTIFIFDLHLAKIEKCRFLVFDLWEETEQFKASVFVHKLDASTLSSRIACSDSEYGLLLLIHIPASYQLNQATKETLASQDSVWDVKVGVTGC